MGQLDDIPPIRRPKGNPVYGDPFRTLDDKFRINTPEPDMLPSKGGGGEGGEEPQDDESEAEHPFAIQIEITSANPSSKSWAATVTVLSGKYQTDGDTQYTAAQVTQSFTTSSGVIKPYVYLFIPLTPKTGGGWTAITGGQILFGANRPLAVWPETYRTAAGGYATAVQIGAWTIQVANISAGVTTYGYRAVINQIIAEDYVLDQVKRTGTRAYTQALSVAGVVPTAAEITTALQSAFPAGSNPSAGDIVNLTVGGVCKLRSTITSQGSASGIYVVSFTVDGVTFYGNQVTTGLY